MMDAVIDEIDGRLIRVGDQWLADFASCNYLGFDLDREIIDAIPAYLDAWGTHPSWSRLLGSPVLYEQIEEQLHRAAGLRGLARPADDHAHPHVGDPAAGRVGDDLPGRARAQDDLRRLPGRARARRRRPALPLRGSRAPRRAAARRARSDAPGLHGRRQQHDRQPAGPARVRARRPQARRAAVRRRRARLRRDRRALGRTRRAPTARRGNSIVRHAGETYDNLVLVGGFSKAYSSLLAFIACPTDVKNLLKVAAPPYLYSGPSPVASLATCSPASTSTRSAAMQMRAELWRLTAARARRACTAGHRDAEPAPAFRSSRSRCATTSASTPSGASSSTAAST